MKWTSCVRAAGGLTCRSSSYRRVGRARLALRLVAHAGVGVGPLLRGRARRRLVALVAAADLLLGPCAAARIAVATAHRAAEQVVETVTAAEIELQHVAAEHLAQEIEEIPAFLGRDLRDDRELRRADLLEGRHGVDRLHPVVVDQGQQRVERVAEALDPVGHALERVDARQVEVAVVAGTAHPEDPGRPVAVREVVLIHPLHHVGQAVDHTAAVDRAHDLVRRAERDLAGTGQLAQVLPRVVLVQDGDLLIDADHEDPAELQTQEAHEAVGVGDESCVTLVVLLHFACLHRVSTRSCERPLVRCSNCCSVGE